MDMTTTATTRATSEGLPAVCGERATAERERFRVVANERGSFDIVALLDTGYVDRAEADATLRRVLDEFTAVPS